MSTNSDPITGHCASCTSSSPYPFPLPLFLFPMLLDISGASRDRSNLHVDFLPVQLNPLIVSHLQTVQVRIFDESNHTSKNDTWEVMTARAPNSCVAVPVESVLTTRAVSRFASAPRTMGLHNSSEPVVMVLNAERLGYFRVLGKELGHCLLVLKFYEFRKPLTSVHLDKDGGSEEELGEIELRLIVTYRVSVVRQVRSVDQAFNWVVAIVTMVNSFSLGCVTEWTIVKKELRRKYIVVLTALLCQFIVLPVVSSSLFCIVLSERFFYRRTLTKSITHS